MHTGATRQQIGAFLIGALLLGASAGKAEQFISVGPYQVHYIVVATPFLTPQVARRYDLQRNVDVALVNISVLRDGKPVRAEVQGIARDLLSREHRLGFREIREPNAIYYLTTLRFAEQEQWRFFLQVRPVGHAVAYPIRFEQRLYREDPP